MKKFFLSLYAQLMTVTGIKYCAMWNNQLQLIEEGHLEQFDMPAVFIEFESLNSNESTMGGGVQIFNPLNFHIHILHKQYDAADGTFEQNLDVYDFKDLVYLAIQKFQPGLTDTTNKVGSCIRYQEIQDYSHKAVYHYIQSYKTTLVDVVRLEPVNGIESDPLPMPAKIDLSTDRADGNEPYVYDFTPPYP